MPKSKKGAQAGESPVLELKLDSKTADGQPVEVAAGGDGGFQTPCTLTGVGAGVSGGSLGFVFGFGGYWMRERLKGQLRASLQAGWSSAQTFAIMGGLYAAVTCLAKRIRQKEDGWNGAAAGCATGLALGYGGGPISALQSCAMFGVFSYFVEGGTLFGGPAQAAPALHSGTEPAISAMPLPREPSTSAGDAPAGCWEPPAAGSFYADGPASSPAAAADPQQPAQWLAAAWAGLAAHSQRRGGATHQQAQRGGEAVRRLLSPAMPLLAALSPCQFGGSGEERVRGCRVARRR